MHSLIIVMWVLVIVSLWAVKTLHVWTSVRSINVRVHVQDHVASCCHSVACLQFGRLSVCNAALMTSVRISWREMRFRDPTERQRRHQTPSVPIINTKQPDCRTRLDGDAEARTVVWLSCCQLCSNTVKHKSSHLRLIHCCNLYMHQGAKSRTAEIFGL